MIFLACGSILQAGDLCVEGSKTEIPLGQDEDIKAFISQGILYKIDYSQAEAYIDPKVWHLFPADQKRGFSLMIACHIRHKTGKPRAIFLINTLKNYFPSQIHSKALLYISS